MYYKSFIFLLFMIIFNNVFAEQKKLDAMKAFIDGDHVNVEVTIRINSILLREKGSLNELKIFDENNPFLDIYDSMPREVQSDLSFPLKAGINTVEIEYYNKSNPNKFPFKVSLKPIRYESPVFSFSSSKKSGKAKGEFFLHNEEPNNYETTVLVESFD